MFRTLIRTFFPNPLDWKLTRARARRAKTVLLTWNRGLGDIALGVAAILHRIRTFLPHSQVTILTREQLRDGFLLLCGNNLKNREFGKEAPQNFDSERATIAERQGASENRNSEAKPTQPKTDSSGCFGIEGIEILTAPWKRGEVYDWKKSVRGRTFDLVLDRPSPTDWCRWQHRTFTPRLKWDPSNDALFTNYSLSEEFIYVGVQVVAETTYGLWRNYPEKRWNELFDLLEAKGNVQVLLFGFASDMQFRHPMICDLRGKTSLFELLSIIKHRCHALILPDSGISAMTYYLDASFPLRLITLWAESNHGLLKQGVLSPNPQLVHIPLMGKDRDLSTISAPQVLEACFPKRVLKPLLHVPSGRASAYSVNDVACVILAGGMGSRLGWGGPKGLFPLMNKTLFQHLVEKIPVNVPVAIMISPSNAEMTRTYFEKNKYFGRNIAFFEQSALPLLDAKYRPLGMGPDGNGSVYASLARSGLLDQWEAREIRSISIIPIENPLAQPVDGSLLDLNVDVAIRCVPRIQGESMGALAEDYSIVEYFDIGQDHYLYSYAGQVVLSTSFFRKAAGLSLPLHWVRKKAVVGGQEMVVWKREKFLFDAFPQAARIAALCYDRESCYATVKNLEHIVAVEQLLRKNKT